MYTMNLFISRFDNKTMPCHTQKLTKKLYTDVLFVIYYLKIYCLIMLFYRKKNNR
jgi:hypothetical protein